MMVSLKTNCNELHTKRLALSQFVFCQGCCCGRTDRGKPELPLDWLKSEWKEKGLGKKVHLTISGCLGPCDLTNVLCVMGPEGQQWIGNLSGMDDYRQVVAWAEEMSRSGGTALVPESLASRVFDRFHAGNEA
jgi:(2Fe-2S) ferredoxin